MSVVSWGITDAASRARLWRGPASTCGCAHAGRLTTLVPVLSPAPVLSPMAAANSVVVAVHLAVKRLDFKQAEHLTPTAGEHDTTEGNGSPVEASEASPASAPVQPSKASTRLIAAPMGQPTAAFLTLMSRRKHGELTQAHLWHLSSPRKSMDSSLPAAARHTCLSPPGRTCANLSTSTLADVPTFATGFDAVDSRSVWRPSSTQTSTPKHCAQVCAHYPCCSGWLEGTGLPS